MRGIPVSVFGRTCSIALSVVLLAGPALQAGPAFASPEAAATGITRGGEAESDAEAAPVPEPTVVRELVDKRGENVTQYLLSDGDIRAVITEVPTRYRDEDGELTDIVPVLVPGSVSGTVETLATPLEVSAGAQVGSQAPVTLTGPDYAVGIDYLGAAEQARVVYGETTRYLDVAQDTDLEYRALRDGIKETVILRSAQAPASHTFRLSLDGLEVRRELTGTFTLYCEGGTEPLLDIGRLVVFDSSRDGADEPTYCEAATMTVEPAGDGYALVTYEVSPEWLQDPARVFPVHVDPTITRTGPSPTKDTYVTSAYPNNSYGSSDELKCGYYDSSTGHNRSYVRFSWSTSDIPAKAYVSSASFETYMFHQYYTNTTTNVRIGRIDEAWPSSTWSWNTKPDYTYIGKEDVTGRGKWVRFEAGPTVQYWVNDYANRNHGFQLYQLNDSTENTYYWKKFYSSDYSNTSYLPKLVVKYSSPSLTANKTGFDKPVYRVGDTVTATLTVNAQEIPQDLNCVEVRVLGVSQATGNTISRGRFAWTHTDPNTSPSATYVNPVLCPGVGGGRVSQHTSDTANVVELLHTSCWEDVVSGQNPATFRFKWRIGQGYADVQNNRIEVRFKMDPANGNDTGNRWTSEWMTVAGTFGVQPGEDVGGVSLSTTASAEWFEEADAGADLIADNRNDGASSGRGSVSLTWGPVPGAGGYDVYLFDGANQRLVGSTPATNTSWSSAGRALYPTDTWIANNSSALAGGANPFSSATRELRDDPRALYAATPGTSVDGVPAYFLKVVPTMGTPGTGPVSAAETITVALEDRTLRVHDDPVRPEGDLGEIAGHSAAARLDTASLLLDVTDLSIPSWGPAAEVSRHYSSAVTATAGFAPGWRFGFDQRVSVAGSVATYTDERGESHRFRASGTSWISANGFFGTLEATTTGGAWAIRFVDRTVKRFDAAGALLSETDANGNAVSYARSGGDLTITAANGQAILVDYTDGVVTSATYATADGTRRVDYEVGETTATVTAYPGTEAARTTTYTYSDDRITGTGVAQASASWTVDYGASSLTVENTSGGDTPSMRRVIACDAAARTATSTDASGAVSAWAWNPTGTIASETDALGALNAYGYDALHLQVHTASPTGRMTRAAHDARGNTLLETDEGGRATRYVYNAAGDLVEETDPKGAGTWRTYDTKGNVTAEERLLTVEGQKSRTEYTYGAYGPAGSFGALTLERSRIDASTWTERAYSDFAPSGEARRIEDRGVKLSASASPVTLVTLASFNAFGNRLSSTDALGVLTDTSTYDIAGRQKTSTDASGTVSNTIYDEAGNATESWRSHESTTAKLDWRRSTYDAAGLLHTETILSSTGTTVSVLTHAYDAAGREVQADDSSVPGVSKTVHDAAGEVVQEWYEGADTTVDTASTRIEINEESEEATVLAPGAESWASVTEYNDDGSVDLETDADGSWTDYDYDDDGDLESETVPTDQGLAETTYTYDLSGNMRTKTEPDGSTTTFTYDLLGRATGVKNGNQPVTTTIYNTLGWVVSNTDFDGIVKTKTYDATGRVTTETVGTLSTTITFDATGRESRRANPDGSVLDLTYDAFGRVERERHTGTDGALAIDRATTYDSAGRVACVADAVSGRTHDFAYAADGDAVITQTGPRTGSVRRSNGTGLLRSFDATLSGRAIDFSVTATDTAGRVTGWVSSALGAVAHYGFDEAGRVVRRGPEPGEVQMLGMPPTRILHTYDAETGLKNHDSLAFVFGGRSEETTYAYDKTGRVVSVQSSGSLPSSRTYTYDPVTGALTSVGGTGGYSLTYGTGGRVATVAGASYTHDSLGRRTASPNRTFAWAGERLVATTGTPSARYTYDASGQRTRSVVTSGSVVTTTTWTYDGITLSGCSATRSDGVTWSVDYVRDESGRPFAGVYASGAATVPFLMVTTDRGDVRELLDSGGKAFAHYAYDVWGNPTATLTAATIGVDATLAAAVASRQVLRYAGYTWDAETSLYYCSQRYYDPRTACFISKDPVKADGEESAYQYCGGDPVGKVDPTGLARVVIRGYPEVPQTTSDCLYVALRSVIQFYSKNNVKPSTAQLIKEGFTNRKYWGKKNRDLLKKKYGLRSKGTGGRLSWKTIKKEIRAKRPMIMGVDALHLNGKKNGLHAVTVVGYGWEKHRSQMVLMNWGKTRPVDYMRFKFGKSGALWPGTNNDRLRMTKGAWWKFRR